MNTIEINGITYRQKAQPERPHYNRAMMKWYMMAQMMGAANGYGQPKPKERPKVDIIKEYGLIQLKKSNLSSRNRQWVVQQFENQFEKIKEP